MLFLNSSKIGLRARDSLDLLPPPLSLVGDGLRLLGGVDDGELVVESDLVGDDEKDEDDGVGLGAVDGGSHSTPCRCVHVCVGARTCVCACTRKKAGQENEGYR